MVASLTVPSTRILHPDPDRYSSWTRYKRVVAWVIRFARNFAATHSMRYSEWLQSGPLKTDELTAAETHVLLKVQQESFPEELTALARQQLLTTVSGQFAPSADTRYRCRWDPPRRRKTSKESASRSFETPNHTSEEA